MSVLLVSDTSVLIDLQRGGMLEVVFQLPFDLGVPDVLYERELREWDGPALQPLGLQVLTLDGDGVTLAQSYRRREPRLSLPDAFALALAKSGGHILLAGDSSLRAQANLEDVECHGVLWILDALEEHGILPPADLLRALTAIAEYLDRLSESLIQKGVAWAAETGLWSRRLHNLASTARPCWHGCRSRTSSS